MALSPIYGRVLDVNSKRKPLRFAVMGCGRISGQHCGPLASGNVTDAELTAVCDVKPDRAERIARKYGVPGFASLEALMTAVGDRVDVITVLTESGSHARHTIEAAGYGRHVVVEKPMALTLADADAMIRTCDDHGVKLFVVKQNRFNAPVMRLREALEAGRFGKLVMGTVRVRWCRDQAYYDLDPWRGTWALDGGVLTNQACHHVDLLQWMMGDVETVFAKSRTALVAVETEDTAVAMLRFSNGALGVVEATTAARPDNLEAAISILGEQGTVEIGGIAVNAMKVWQFAGPAGDAPDGAEGDAPPPPNVYGHGHQAYLNHVVDCILNNAKPLVDGREGRRSLELISAMYESIETGREVSFPFTPSHCRLGRSG